MRTFEYESDCPPVERLLWGKVAVDCGDFAGIRELSFDDLLAIKSAADFQLAKIFKDSEDADT